MNLDTFLSQQGYSGSTIREYNRIIKKFLLWCEKESIPPEEISYSDLTAYQQEALASGLSPQSITVKIASLKSFFYYLVAFDKRVDNPAMELRIKVPGTVLNPKLLSGNELDELYELHCKYIAESPWTIKHSRELHIVLMGLLIYQGLVGDEIHSLLSTDFDLDKGVVEIAETQNIAGRILKLDSRQIVPLMRLLHTMNREKLIDKKMQLATFFINQFSKLYKVTGQRYTVRKIRASRIIIWLSQYNIRQVQYMAGLKHISSLERYRRIDTKSLQEELERFFPQV